MLENTRSIVLEFKKLKLNGAGNEKRNNNSFTINIFTQL